MRITVTEKRRKYSDIFPVSTPFANLLWPIRGRAAKAQLRLSIKPSSHRALFALLDNHIPPAPAN